MLQTTDYLLLDHMAPNYGLLDISEIIKSDFSGCFDNSKKGEVSGQILSMGG